MREELLLGLVPIFGPLPEASTNHARAGPAEGSCLSCPPRRKAPFALLDKNESPGTGVGGMHGQTKVGGRSQGRSRSNTHL